VRANAACLVPTSAEDSLETSWPFMTGIGNRESGIGNRESGIGNRESAEKKGRWIPEHCSEHSAN
jgi:hypothetical protein